jgi:D-proline reductase (dithiol) PrdB
VLARGWGRSFDAITNDNVPFARLRKPLHACRIALITTGGVHLRVQPPFDMGDSQGDPSFRIIPADTHASQLTITHDYYDHRDAGQDLNILFPLGLGRELVAQGALGGLGTCYSFMGHIEPPHVETLVRQTALEVARRLRQEQIDAVLLTPA